LKGRGFSSQGAFVRNISLEIGSKKEKKIKESLTQSKNRYWLEIKNKKGEKQKKNTPRSFRGTPD